MHAGIIFFLVILGSILFHIFTPWYWTDIASNWQGMDDTITPVSYTHLRAHET